MYMLKSILTNVVKGTINTTCGSQWSKQVAKEVINKVTKSK